VVLPMKPLDDYDLSLEVTNNLTLFYGSFESALNPQDPLTLPSMKVNQTYSIRLGDYFFTSNSPFINFNSLKLLFIFTTIFFLFN
jgi:hypothetical protein